MQNLDVISVNLWQILISLCNLLLLFVVIRKFLWQPVKKFMAQRQELIDGQYAAADSAQREAEENRKNWEEKMQGAQSEADVIIKKAAAAADRRSDKIVSDAREKADGIIRDAETQAALEHKKAEAEIKKEIVDVSALLAEMMLRREIKTEDHRSIIDSVISELGDGSEN